MYSVKKLTYFFSKNYTALNHQISYRYGGEGCNVWLLYTIKLNEDELNINNLNPLKYKLYTKTVTVDTYKSGMSKLNPRIQAYKILYLSNEYLKND